MSIKNITVIVEPLQVGETFFSKSSPSPKTVHEAANYIQLVNEFRERTTANVVLLETFLHEAPPMGIIILYPRQRGLSFEQNLDECEPNLRKTLPQRLVLLNVARPPDELLSQYRMAAVIKDFDYDNWWNIEQLSLPRQRMNGLTAVAKEMGVFFRFEREGYCQMIGEEFERLPTLLIRYLEAYARMFPGVLQ